VKEPTDLVPKDHPSNLPVIREVEPESGLQTLFSDQALVRQRLVQVARPDPGNPDLLHRLRDIFKKDAGIRRILTEARQAKAPVEGVSAEVIEALEGAKKGPELEMAVQHLVAEHLEFGDVALLISRQTGRAIARLSEEDFEIPAPVEREDADGRIYKVERPVRVKPEIEAALTVWSFDTERDQQIVRKLQEKHRGLTPLIREQGDPRLAIFTREGRQKTADNLLPEIKKRMKDLRGLARPLVEFITRTMVVSEEPIQGKRHTAYSRTWLTRISPEELNPMYDFTGRVYRGTLGSWMGYIATLLAMGEMEEGPYQPGGLILGEPQTLPKGVPYSLPAYCYPTVAMPCACRIYIDEAESKVETADSQGAWFLEATLAFDLAIDESKLWRLK